MSGIPKGWEWTTIGEIGQVASGGTPSTKQPRYYDGNISWVTPKDLSGYTEKYISKGSRSITKDGLDKSSAKLLPKGSVLFSSRAPIGYCVIAANEIATNQGFKNLIPNEGVLADYVYHYLKGNKQLAEKHASGTTFLEISGKAFSKLPIPLPPLPEQRRIVARIEELFSRLDAGVAALREAKAQLKRYRQSVLTAAVTGQLTAQWREQHPDVEPASELLERILKQRREQWCGKGKYREPASSSEIPADIPTTWASITFGHICQVQGGFAFKSGDFVTEGVSLVKIASLRNGRVDLEHKPTFLPQEYLDKYSRFALRKGDTLIAMSGATTGKMGIFDAETPSLLNQRVGRFLPSAEANVFPSFLSLLVENVGARVLKDAYGAAQPNISPSEIEEMCIPLPPLAEQHQIVAEVEARTTAIDHLETELDRQITRSNRMRQSVLKTAFNGGLL